MRSASSVRKKDRSAGRAVARGRALLDAPELDEDAFVFSLVLAGEGDASRELHASTAGDLDLDAGRIELRAIQLTCGVESEDLTQSKLVSE